VVSSAACLPSWAARECMGWGAPQAAAMLPWVILSQPITAFAFTLDGVLYGAR